MTEDERAAHAREVLTVAIEHMAARDAVIAAHELTTLRDERYPAPPPPVTVTVGDWKCSVVPHARDCIVEHIQRAQLPFTSPQGAPLYECVLRIAADAAVIAEKDARIVELERERDAARRALEEKQDHDAVRAAQERSHATTGRLVREMQQTSPAPIPLGAVVNDGRTAWSYQVDGEGAYWEAVGIGGATRWVYECERHFDALCALYRALHPVADAATVERVALRVKQYNGPTAVSAEGFARIILEELGYTIQEGA